MKNRIINVLIVLGLVLGMVMVLSSLLSRESAEASGVTSWVSTTMLDGSTEYSAATNTAAKFVGNFATTVHFITAIIE